MNSATRITYTWSGSCSHH